MQAAVAAEEMRSVAVHDLVAQANTCATYAEAERRFKEWLGGEWYSYHAGNGGTACCTLHRTLFPSAYFTDGLLVLCESSNECEVPMALPAEKYQQLMLLAQHGGVRLREHHNAATFNVETASGHWWDQSISIASRDLIVSGFATLLFVP